MPVLYFFLWVLIWPGPRKLVPLHIRNDQVSNSIDELSKPRIDLLGRFLGHGRAFN